MSRLNIVVGVAVVALVTIGARYDSDAVAANAILEQLDGIELVACDWFCDDCKNSEHEFTHAWPGGGSEDSELPWCHEDVDCGDLSCGPSEEEQDVQLAFDLTIQLLESAGPAVIAHVVRGSDGLVTLNEDRMSIQVRRCPDRIVANLPLSAAFLATVSAELGDQ